MSDDFNKFNKEEEEELKKKIEEIDLSKDTKYSENYSEDNFWNKIKKFTKKAGLNVISYALALYYVLQSPDIDLKIKTIIIAALGYFILPFDIIPDFIPIFGFADDAGILAIAFKIAKAMVTDDVIEKVYEKTNAWFDVSKDDIVAILK
ncbi:MAG: DUF1232 domain-containing protein [Fusobacteriaceae bacterium]|nr:DUF1232 domain-containing protein [Fusobacteriaceae bacterium]